MWKHRRKSFVRQPISVNGFHNVLTYTISLSWIDSTDCYANQIICNLVSLVLVCATSFEDRSRSLHEIFDTSLRYCFPLIKSKIWSKYEIKLIGNYFNSFHEMNDGILNEFSFYFTCPTVCCIKRLKSRLIVNQ